MQFHAFSLVIQKFRQRDYTTGIFDDNSMKEGFILELDACILD